MAEEIKTEQQAEPTTTEEMPPLEEGKNQEEMPPLEEQAEGSTEVPPGMENLPGSKKPSRAEKKNRKALQKMGLKPFPGVLRIQIRQRGHNVVISDAEVYKATGDLYVFFGTPQSEDQQLSKAKQQEALQDVLKQAQQGGLGNLESQLGNLGLTGDEKTTETTTKVEEEPEGEEDATGLTEKDIELVMTQGGTNRATAIRTLRKNNGDIVQSIMDLANVKQG